MLNFWPGEKPADILCSGRNVSEAEKLSINLIVFRLSYAEHLEEEKLKRGLEQLEHMR